MRASFPARIAAAVRNLRASRRFSVLAWGVIVLVLVGGPLLFTVAREDRFEARVEVIPTVPPSKLEPTPFDYLHALAGDELVHNHALALIELRGREDLTTQFSLTPVAGERPRYALVVPGDTPERAASLTSALAESMAAFSGKSGELDEGEARLVVGPRPAPPEPESWVDRLVDALPGEFPPRPSPLWAGIAGFLVAVAVWTILRLRRPGR